jgi:hypothetical protein
MMGKSSGDPRQELATFVARRGAERVGRQLGTSAANVRKWVTGKRTPTGAAQVAMQSVLGIAWDGKPQTQPEPSPAPAANGQDPSHEQGWLSDPALTSRERFTRILRETERQLGACDEHTNPAIRARLLNSLAQTTARLARLEDLPEVEFVRSEHFQRLKQLLVAALAEHPAALKAVHEVLRKALQEQKG